MNKNKLSNTSLIPIVIITRMNGPEYNGDIYWKQKNSKGIWILGKNKPQEFKELIGLYGQVKNWEVFENKTFNVPDNEITTLVIDGYTDDEKPHQFEIIWHLIFKEQCNIGFILVHRNELRTDCEWQRYISSTESNYVKVLDNEKVIEFKKDGSPVKIPYVEYSFQDSIPGDWIRIIAKAVGLKNLSCAVKRLKELKDLLDKSKNNIELINKSRPKPCYVYEMISWLPNLFLDLLIDSTGLWEIVDGRCSPTERRAKVAEVRIYLEVIIKDKSTGAFRQKLADARYLAFGETYGTGTLNCNGDKTSGSVPEKSSEYLREKFENENLNEILKRSDLKDNLARHLGLIQTGNNLQEDKEDPDNPILKFLCAWDCLIEKGLDKVDDNSIFSIVDSHQEYSKWYDQLVEITDELKKQIR